MVHSHQYSALASGARCPRFDPHSQQVKFWVSKHAFFSVICRMTLNNCAALLIGTFTGCQAVSPLLITPFSLITPFTSFYSRAWHPWSRILEFTFCFSCQDRYMWEKQVFEWNLPYKWSKCQYFTIIKMLHCILTTQALNIYKKSYPVVGVWSCQQSHMTISELCRSTVDAQCGMWL